MKKAALLIDGGWFAKGLGKQLKLPMNWPSAKQLLDCAKSVLEDREEIFRIFYYDCEPFDKKVTNPIDQSEVDYQATPSFKARKNFFNELSQMEYVAMRRGELKARGWELSDRYKKRLLDQSLPHAAPNAGDVYPGFQQKGVDMRIGIDVAILSLKRLVDRIILFSGDTDMIPAMKLARREGVQVYLVKLGSWPLKQNLIEDSDGVRILKI
ncbi:MAG: NYN domain-containing protein [Verrucomicrobiae bacterium]|nr:NYN domain-containing protein [Verrucomicrobiae bacterium]